MPFDAWTPVGFGITVAIELFICHAFLTVSMSYMALYYTICTHVDSFIEDFGSIISDSNDRIRNRLSMKMNLVELVEHHLHGYKTLKMLENIMSAPIIMQISVFCAQLAIMLFAMENVRIFLTNSS